MNYEIFLKLATVAGSVYALYKGIVLFEFIRKSKLREEFKFAKKFIKDLKVETHPFVIEMGYKAISGKGNLAAQEIVYLLSLSSPVKAIEYFSAARKYVELTKSTTDGMQRIAFREAFTESTRMWKRRLNLFLYFFFASLAFAPIPFSREIFGNNWQVSLVVIVMAMLSFGPLAFDCLKEYQSIKRSEELVTMSAIAVQ